MRVVLLLLVTSTFLFSCGDLSKETAHDQAFKRLDSYRGIDVHHWRVGNEICMRKLTQEELVEREQTNEIPERPPLEELVCGIGFVVDSEAFESGDLASEFWRAGIAHEIAQPIELPGLDAEYWIYWAAEDEDQRKVGIEIIRRYVPEYPLEIPSSTSTE